MKFLHAFMSNMTKTAVPQVCGIQLICLSTFSVIIMDVCFPIKINNKEPALNRLMEIEDIIHINRTTIVL